MSGKYILIGVAIVVTGVVLSQVLWINFAGKAVPRPQVSRDEQLIGSQGTALRYVVLGDSTALSQGGEYAQGYATASAEFLAKQGHVVFWSNKAVSGARAKDVPQQLDKVLATAPDIVLIAVGANDVTHLGSPRSVVGSLGETVDALRVVQPDVKIIVTGAPDMGSVPRFPQPTRWFMGERTKQLNTAIEQFAQDEGVIFAPIARTTGPAFRQHPEYFAQDKFHPNTQGYALWTPVITDALRAALQD